MTIEIKQLVIRAIVEERRERAPAAAPRPQAALAPAPRAATPESAELDREAIIAECTRQVLRELRKGRGR